MRGPKIIIHPEKLAAFQHAPLSVSEEVRSIEREHSKYEDVLAFLATATPFNSSEDDPRVEQDREPESALTEYRHLNPSMLSKRTPLTSWNTSPWATRTSPC